MYFVHQNGFWCQACDTGSVLYLTGQTISFSAEFLVNYFLFENRPLLERLCNGGGWVYKFSSRLSTTRKVVKFVIIIGNFRWQMAQVMRGFPPKVESISFPFNELQTFPYFKLSAITFIARTWCMYPLGFDNFLLCILFRRSHTFSSPVSTTVKGCTSKLFVIFSTLWHEF